MKISSLYKIKMNKTCKNCKNAFDKYLINNLCDTCTPEQKEQIPPLKTDLIRNLKSLYLSEPFFLPTLDKNDKHRKDY